MKNTLNPEDLKAIDNLLYKRLDDVAVSILRGMERLEERIDVLEERLTKIIHDDDDLFAESLRSIREDTNEIIKIVGAK